MKEFFRDTSFRPDSRTLITQCNTIIEDYQEQNLRLTLRQLYYQLVTRNTIKNSERSYQNLSSLVSNGRLAGRVDWEAIEDRVRRPRKAAEWNNLGDIVRSAAYSYRLPRWKGQLTYVELWVEKDALAGVLEPIANEYHATLMVNRGYSSQSAMYEAAKRFLRNRKTTVAGLGCPQCRRSLTENHLIRGKDSKPGQGRWVCPRAACNWEGAMGEAKPTARVPRKLKLFYLGDHDPSGEDMVRDIADRLEMFGVPDLEVRKIGLTMDQVRQYNPPPNPAKIEDPRAKEYIKKFGPHSWEVDALPPDVLTRLIRTAFQGVIDMPLMDAIKTKEERDKRRLRVAVEAILCEDKEDPEDDPDPTVQDEVDAETDEDDDDA